MKQCSFLIVAFVLVTTACHTPRQAVSPIPIPHRDTVIIERIDTFITAFPLYVADTVLVDFDSASFFFGWEKAWTKVFLKKDTVFRIRIETQIKTDTLTVIRQDTVFTERIVTQEAEPQGFGEKIPWWVWAILTVVFSILGYNLKKKKKTL
jgi:hypothetical protein